MAVIALHARLQRELAALPGVTAVGAPSALPLTAGADQVSAQLPGAPGNTGDRDHDRQLVDVMPALPGYFDAMGIRVLTGRAVPKARPAGVREALIDRTLATEFFPAGSPVGSTMVLDGADSVTVVGVVEHACMYDIHQDGRSQIYVRNEDFTYRTLTWVLRTDRSPLELVPEVRAAIRRVDPQLAISEVRTMNQVVEQPLRQPRLSAVLLAGFSLGALLLAAMGLFGVVAGSVSRRRHEITVRLALGADQGGVLRLVLWEGARLVVLGLLLGAPGIYLAGRAVGHVLVDLSPFDPATLGAVAGRLGLVALVACYIPARRVAEIEPARLLRQG